MTPSQVEMEQKKTLEQEVKPLILKTANLCVKSQEDKEILIKEIKTANELKDRIEERFHPTENKEKARKVYEALLATEHEFYDPIDEFLSSGKKAIKRYETEEAIRIQREAQLAEAKRQDIERKEKERLEEKARKAEEKGKVEQAEALREQAETVVVQPVFTPPPKTAAKLVWKAKVKNMFALCRSIADGLIPFNVLKVSQSDLNSWAKGHDGKTDVPGIEFYQEAATRIA